jgi:D-glycero-D-manno-heptose 1,7-bisphosphate phosphatase
VKPAPPEGVPAVFLDRDGVLNDVVERNGMHESPRTADEFRLAAGAGPAVRRLRDAGHPVFVVTNQPDLARGTLSPAEHERMVALLRAAVPVVDVAVCPHDDAAGCGCRKPKPGMLLDLAARYGVDLRRSVIVGDTWKDMEAGRRAGCRRMLVRRSYNEAAEADEVVATLDDAVDRILQHLKVTG